MFKRLNRRHRRRAPRERERGTSLVEVLIATLLLTGALVGVAQLLAVSVSLHRLGRNHAEATRLGQAKFEEIMKLNFATAPGIQVSPTSPNPLGQNVTNYNDTADGYTRRWRVQAGPNADLRIVTVRVIPPTTQRIRTKDLELTTMVRSW